MGPVVSQVSLPGLVFNSGGFSFTLGFFQKLCSFIYERTSVPNISTAVRASLHPHEARKIQGTLLIGSTGISSASSLLPNRSLVQLSASPEHSPLSNFHTLHFPPALTLTSLLFTLSEILKVSEYGFSCAS